MCARVFFFVNLPQLAASHTFFIFEGEEEFSTRLNCELWVQFSESHAYSFQNSIVTAINAYAVLAGSFHTRLLHRRARAGSLGAGCHPFRSEYGTCHSTFGASSSSAPPPSLQYITDQLYGFPLTLFTPSGVRWFVWFSWCAVAREMAYMHAVDFLMQSTKKLKRKRKEIKWCSATTNFHSTSQFGRRSQSTPPYSHTASSWIASSSPMPTLWRARSNKHVVAPVANETKHCIAIGFVEGINL